MAEVKTSFVAIFDVLGFTNLVESLGAAGLYSKYSNLRDMAFHATMPGMKDSEIDGFKVVVSDPATRRAGLRIFSDTIMMWSEDNQFSNFADLIVSVDSMLKSGYLLSFPLRGSVGYGDLIINKESDITIGSAIIDAYRGEQSQVWSGCALTPACEKYIRDNHFLEKLTDKFTRLASSERHGFFRRRLLGFASLLVEANIPTKRKFLGWQRVGYRKGLAVNWTHCLAPGAAKNSFQPVTKRKSRESQIQNETLKFELIQRAKTMSSCD